MPKQFRDDPFADPPPITENDIHDGMFSLLNRGIIPRDVDLTPAFERGSAPFAFNKAPLNYNPINKPKHLTANITSPGARRALPPFSGQEPNQTQNDDTFIT